MTFNEILKKIDENRVYLKKYGVKKIGLFGSYVRNQARPDSDIDILVEFEQGRKNFDNYMNLMFFLQDLLKHKIDLVISERLKPDFKPYILRSVKYAAA